VAFNCREQRCPQRLAIPPAAEDVVRALHARDRQPAGLLQLVHHAAGFFPSTLLPASSAFREIAATAKSLILKAARAVNSGRPLDSAACSP
jgi:hypothetical protein